MMVVMVMTVITVMTVMIAVVVMIMVMVMMVMVMVMIMIDDGVDDGSFRLTLRVEPANICNCKIFYPGRLHRSHVLTVL